MVMRNTVILVDEVKMLVLLLKIIAGLLCLLLLTIIRKK